ncbi:MAG: glycosyltransferase family 4 protein [Chthonomonadetes bacterium]|nr:glycosyltransferase family 4 protein [Chthonomonadetes bacterium]
MSTRIGFVHFGAYPDIRVVKMTDTLAKAGYEVIVLARNMKGAGEPGASHPYAASQRVEEAEWRSRLRLRRLLNDVPERWRAPLTLPYHINPVWRRAIRDLVLKDGCQLLIVRDMPLVLAATAVGRRYGVPVIFDMAENYPAVMAVWRRWEGAGRAFINLFARNITLARMVERMAVRCADVVLVVVPEHVQRVAGIRGTDNGIFVIENTPVLCDLDMLYNHYATQPEWTPSEDILEVVYGGNIHFYRGIDTLIESAAVLKRKGVQDVRFTLVGTGKVASRLQELARQGGVDDVVCFMGWQADLMAFVYRGHVGYDGSHASEHTHNTMPNKVYEYMAFRKPVLVSDCRPMKRLVEETGCGLVFRSQDAEDLAEKVLMLRDPALRAEMGARGRKAVEERYNWGVDGTKFLDTVHQVLDRAGECST